MAMLLESNSVCRVIMKNKVNQFPNPTGKLGIITQCKTLTEER